MRAAIYARFSSHNQTEQSIEGQMRDCLNYANTNGIHVVCEYIDRAISAKTDNRPQFQKMIKDSEKGLFDVILVWKLDRFCRNRYDSATYKARLRRNGVKVISVMENISDEPEGILVESLLEGMAEYYSAELAQKIKRGMRESALKCKVTGALPIGYKSDADKNIILDEEKAPIVAKIFELYANGLCATDIIEYLSAKNLKTQKGQPFNKNSIPRILSNPRYKGIYIYGEHTFPDAIPRIVSDELWEKVQKMLNKNKKAGAKQKARADYILTTKLFCGYCKSMMIGESGTGKYGDVYNYYKCAAKKNHTLECNKKNEKKEYIENLVVENIYYKILMDDEIIERIADKAMEAQASTKSDGILDVLNAELSEAQKALNNLMTAIESGVVTKTTKKRLDELEATIDNLEFEIQKEKAEKPILDRSVIIFLLDKLRDGDLSDINYRKRLINTFVHKIFLYDDKLLIIYNYTNRDTNVQEEQILALIEGKSSDINASAPPIVSVSEHLFFFGLALCQLIELKR